LGEGRQASRQLSDASTPRQSLIRQDEARGACNRQAACEPIAIGWPAYRVVGKQLALVSKSAGQRTKHIFEALLKLTNKMAGSMG